MLLDLIEEHTEEFEYEWRARFNRPLTDLFNGGMSWREAWSLTQVLARDPSSWLCAVLNEWEYPLSRGEMATMDLYDLQHRAKSKRKPKPYPRPFPDKAKTRFGKTDLPPDEVRSILAARSPVRAA